MATLALSSEVTLAPRGRVDRLARYLDDAAPLSVGSWPSVRVELEAALNGAELDAEGWQSLEALCARNNGEGLSRFIQVTLEQRAELDGDPLPDSFGLPAPLQVLAGMGLVAVVWWVAGMLVWL